MLIWNWVFPHSSFILFGKYGRASHVFACSIFWESCSIIIYSILTSVLTLIKTGRWNSKSSLHMHTLKSQLLRLFAIGIIIRKECTKNYSCKTASLMKIAAINIKFAKAIISLPIWLSWQQYTADASTTCWAAPGALKYGPWTWPSQCPWGAACSLIGTGCSGTTNEQQAPAPWYSKGAARPAP